MNPAELIHERDSLRTENAQLRAEIKRLENLTASGVHTCSTHCQRPMCVLRRERDKARAEIARVTADRDRMEGYANSLAARAGSQATELATLRARVAEQEKAIAQLVGRLDAEKARVAELVAALRDVRPYVVAATGRMYDGAQGREIRETASARLARLDVALARESATPAKHPGTACPHCGAQTMDPFTGTTQIHDMDSCAARKQGGAHV